MIRRIKQMLIPLFLRTQSAENIFTRIYRKNSWGDGESLSGPGSNLVATQTLRENLVPFFKSHNIRSIIDAPCGDYNWFRHIDYAFDQYTGYDIVQPLIDNNTRLYGTDRVAFKCLNVLQDDIGKADVILCRDLLIHFSVRDIFRFFHNLRRAEVPLILVSQYIGAQNRDIATGDCRPVNLTEAPFNLPEPLEILPEGKDHMGQDKQSTKVLALWNTADIFAALDHNDSFKQAA